MRFLISLTVLFISFTASAADIEPYFEALKQSRVNYEPDGAICEMVGLLQYAQDYPSSDYILASGIEYSTGELTLGELDIVIIDRNTAKVVLVSEVKCWKNQKQALEKVKSQRQRFLYNLAKFPRKMNFETFSDLRLRPDQFDSKTLYKSLSDFGGVRHGFDEEMELTLSELKQLRMKLLKCQQFEDCAQPE
ncbi:hypothetical protein [Bdellovibrio reynosensis]|uniref:NERD domain-containing protein n=1 Tax=Bdellovibrio reynosensis TaxID=2835041 RepID=A0ABY4CCA1_9BACT|nr:hypothetical protein [Bdellovibrio reynosensis]UOF02349.1 hypothetical protein MNR06_05215 [Bdellovibrio reynosensis]